MSSDHLVYHIIHEWLWWRGKSVNICICKTKVLIFWGCQAALIYEVSQAESLSQTSWEWIPAFQALASNYWMSPMRRRGEEGWMNFQHDPEREYWPKLTLHHIFLDSPSGVLLWCILTWIFIWCSQIWFLLVFSLLHPSAVLSQIKKLFLFKKTSSQASNMLWFGGELVKRYPFSSFLLHVKTSDLFMVERHLKL